jgi:lipopolysaccharide/colanic/teichoic acid biosynthesis glycosyltransferase
VTRILDAAVSGAGLVLLSPLLLAIVLAIKLTSPGPAIYRATRIGRDGVPFRLYKFRSMVTGADKTGPGITTAADRRVTAIGSFLRKTKLDELPQLANVLRGEMSLVGPRPEDPRYVAHYTPMQREVLRARPGITSPASLRYRDESALLTGPDWEKTYVDTIMPEKLAIELAYLRRRNLLTDARLIVLTLWAVIARGDT